MDDLLGQNLDRFCTGVEPSTVVVVEQTGRARWIGMVGPSMLVVLALAVLVFAAFGSPSEGIQTSWLPTLALPMVLSVMLFWGAPAFSRRRMGLWSVFLVVWALLAGWTAAAVGDGSPTAVAVGGVVAAAITYPLWRLLERARARHRTEQQTES